MTLNIKEKHLYRIRGGDLAYVLIAPTETRIGVYIAFKSKDISYFYDDGKLLKNIETKFDLIEEIPTPPIDFSRIGEVNIDGDILFFTISQTGKADFNGVAFNAISVNRFNMNYWQPAQPKEPETIEVHGQKYRVEDVLKLKPVGE